MEPATVLLRSTLTLPLKAGTSPDCGQEKESLKRFVWKVCSGRVKLPFIVSAPRANQLRVALVKLQAWGEETVSPLPHPGTASARSLIPGMDDPRTNTVTLPCLSVPRRVSD